MELRPSLRGQNPNSNKNRNLAFGSPFVSEMLPLSFPSLPPGVFQQSKKDFIQRELIGSPTNGVEDASPRVSGHHRGRKVVLLALHVRGSAFSFGCKCFVIRVCLKLESSGSFSEKHHQHLCKQRRRFSRCLRAGLKKPDRGRWLVLVSRTMEFSYFLKS